MLNLWRSTTPNDVVVLGLPPEVSTGVPPIAVSRNWWAEYLYNVYNVASWGTHVLFSLDVDDYPHHNFYLFDLNLHTKRSFRIPYWTEPKTLQTLPASPTPARRGKAIPSDVSDETLRKAKRAGAFFVSVTEPNGAKEEDPDYGF